MFTFPRFAAACLSAALLAGGPASAQSPADPAPIELLRAAREAGQAPAIAAAVITPDRIQVYADGQRRADRPGAVSGEDPFHIGSDLKAMVATVVAQEIERGRLRWDSTIGEILPDVAIFARKEYRRVTITQLLQHRAGIWPMIDQAALGEVPRFKGSVPAQRVRFARWVLRKPALSRPGTETEYSNAGYIVAAAMLERVTGKRTEELLQKRLFAPLGITTARFDWPAGAAPRGHAFAEGQLIPVNPRDPSIQLPEWASVAGHLSLSTRDFARFVQLHLRGLRGESNYLQPETFRKLHEPVNGYACGWLVVDSGGPSIHLHAGGTDLFYAVMVIVPDLERAAVVVTNADHEAIEEAALTLSAQLVQGVQ